MIKIAHRGYSSKFRENTMRSFIAALNKKFDMIELDIQLCRSGEIVVYHDLTIKDYKIIDLTLTELKEIDKDLITLDEFFRKIDSFKIKIFLDVKGFSEIVYPLKKFLINSVYKIYLPNIFISSFNLEIVEMMKTYPMSFKLGFTTCNVLTDKVKNQLIDNIDFVCIDYSVINKKDIHYLKSKKILVFSCTCKNDLILSYLKNFDLDGIVSDILI